MKYNSIRPKDHVVDTNSLSDNVYHVDSLDTYHKTVNVTDVTTGLRYTKPLSLLSKVGI